MAGLNGMGLLLRSMLAFKLSRAPNLRHLLAILYGSEGSSTHSATSELAIVSHMESHTANMIEVYSVKMRSVLSSATWRTSLRRHSLGCCCVETSATIISVRTRSSWWSAHCAVSLRHVAHLGQSRSFRTTSLRDQSIQVAIP